MKGWWWLLCFCLLFLFCKYIWSKWFLTILWRLMSTYHLLTLFHIFKLLRSAYLIFAWNFITLLRSSWLLWSELYIRIYRLNWKFILIVPNFLMFRQGHFSSFRIAFYRWIFIVIHFSCWMFLINIAFLYTYFI